MKIKTITFTNASNFGATLQCMALTHVLETLGGEVEVINYVPEYIADKQSIFKEYKKALSTFKKNHNVKLFVKGMIKGTAYIVHIKELRLRRKCFNAFIDDNISVTRKYSSLNELRRSVPDSDIIICGSDQIWNPALTGGKPDLAFYIGFAPKNVKRIAYGVSMGEFDVESSRDELIKLTKDFAAISVRESSAAARLEKTIGKTVEVVCDPTMLLTAEDYEPMCAETDAEQPYILMYNIQNSDLSASLAKKLAKRSGFKIYDISPNPLKKYKDMEKIVGIGPAEFLSYVKNAEYVVTNSFHGTVFSIIFKRQFLSVLHDKRSDRVVDMLKQLKLEQRICKSLNDYHIYKNKLDYGVIESRLEKLRMQSMEFLTGSINQ